MCGLSAAWLHSSTAVEGGWSKTDRLFLEMHVSYRNVCHVVLSFERCMSPIGMYVTWSCLLGDACLL